MLRKSSLLIALEQIRCHTLIPLSIKQRSIKESGLCHQLVPFHPLHAFLGNERKRNKPTPQDGHLNAFLFLP